MMSGNFLCRWTSQIQWHNYSHLWTSHVFDLSWWRFWTVWSKDNHFGAASKEILITELELDFNSCRRTIVRMFKGLVAQTEKHLMKLMHESPERRNSKHENIRTNWPGQLLSFWTAWPHWLSLGKSETVEKQAGFHFGFLLIS